MGDRARRGRKSLVPPHPQISPWGCPSFPTPCMKSWLIQFIFISFRNCARVPIFEKPPKKYSAYRIMQILLSPNIDPKRIAKKSYCKLHLVLHFLWILASWHIQVMSIKTYMGSGSTLALILTSFVFHFEWWWCGDGKSSCWCKWRQCVFTASPTQCSSKQYWISEGFGTSIWYVNYLTDICIRYYPVDVSKRMIKGWIPKAERGGGRLDVNQMLSSIIGKGSFTVEVHACSLFAHGITCICMQKFTSTLTSSHCTSAVGCYTLT